MSRGHVRAKDDIWSTYNNAVWFNGISVTFRWQEALILEEPCVDNVLDTVQIQVDTKVLFFWPS